MDNIQTFINILDERDRQKDINRKQKRNNILVFAGTLLAIVLIIGIVGYMSIFNLEFTDAVYNTALVLTAIDVPDSPISTPQKVFVIFFALMSTILLLSIIISSIDAVIDTYIDNR